VEHELDTLGVLCISIPLEILGLGDVGVEVTAGYLDDAGLGLLKLASKVGMFAACELEELGLRTHDGLVNFVGIRAAGNREVCMITVILETVLYMSVMVLFCPES